MGSGGRDERGRGFLSRRERERGAGEVFFFFFFSWVGPWFFSREQEKFSGVCSSEQLLLPFEVYFGNLSNSQASATGCGRLVETRKARFLDTVRGDRCFRVLLTRVSSGFRDAQEFTC